MTAHYTCDVRIRPATEDDREFLHRIAPRLLVGYAPWRDSARMLATMEGYLLDGIDVNPEQGTLLIAERSDGTRLGAVSVSHHQNFTGEQQAYMGELAVIEEEEGHGIGHILADAAEEWARERGHTLLVLDTGAANTRARRFYTNLGYREESVRLVKLLDTASV